MLCVRLRVRAQERVRASHHSCADGSGFIDEAEIQRIVREVYGTEGAKTNVYARTIIEKLDSMAEASVGGNGIARKEFSTFVSSHPALLFPAFVMQTEVRRGLQHARARRDDVS